MAPAAGYAPALVRLTGGPPCYLSTPECLFLPSNISLKNLVNNPRIAVISRAKELSIKPLRITIWISGITIIPTSANHKKQHCYLLYYLWARMDSNHRTRMGTVLQPAAFNHSATDPNVYTQTTTASTPCSFLSLSL
jgi:hypothetical protein